MHELIATYKIVTPMFIGGAGQSPSDGIRPPSVKGALRFWWRALNWGRFWATNEGDEVVALRALHDEEARLFGGTDSGQGVFLLSIQQVKGTTLEKIWNSIPAKYMAYGLLDGRDSIKEGGEFDVKMKFKLNSDKKDIQQIEEALKVWSLFGGLGGRSRRAMGSITLTKLNNESILYSKEDYIKKSNDLLFSFEDIPQAPFTAFSKDTLFRTAGSNTSARTLVEKMGNIYKTFRENNKEGKNAFGDANPRRSSPLFFHVHQLTDNNCIASNLFLPARIYLHDNEDLSMNIINKFMGEK